MLSELGRRFNRPERFNRPWTESLSRVELLNAGMTNGTINMQKYILPGNRQGDGSTVYLYYWFLRCARFNRARSGLELIRDRHLVTDALFGRYLYPPASAAASENRRLG